jgi:hypothetical protein
MGFTCFQPWVPGSVAAVSYGFFTHRGVIHSIDATGTVWVIDNTWSRGCVGFQTLQQFADGRAVVVERVPSSWFEGFQIVVRAESKLNHAYGLLTFTCDHLVTFALGQNPESKQVQAYVGLGVACCVAALIAGNSNQ